MDANLLVRHLIRGAVVVVVATSGVAAAQGVAPAKDDADAPGPDPGPAGEPGPATGGAEPRLLPAAKAGPPPSDGVGYSHKGQLQVSARLGVGLRAIVPYDSMNYCGESDGSTTYGNAPVCTGRAPFSLDLELGYGVARRIDVFVETRLGLEADFGATATRSGGPRMFHLSPGARFFFSDAKSSKLFTTAQVVLDFAGYEDAAGAGRGADFGIRNLSGLWFDLDRAYGFYAYIGETATFGRWMRFELEAGFGVSGRYN